MADMPCTWYPNLPCEMGTMTRRIRRLAPLERAVAKVLVSRERAPGAAAAAGEGVTELPRGRRSLRSKLRRDRLAARLRTSVPSPQYTQEPPCEETKGAALSSLCLKRKKGLRMHESEVWDRNEGNRHQNLLY